MAAKKRVVVFDFDGVIADSFDLHLACWQEVLGGLGASVSDEALMKTMGWSSPDTARSLLKSASVQAKPDEVAERKKALFRKRAAKELEPMSGSVDAVERLSEGFHVAVTSGRSRKTTETALDRFGIRAQFDAVLTSDDLGPRDELDDLLSMVVDRVGLKRGSGVMVDDSRNGLLAAERAGMKSVAFDSNPKFQVDYSMADAVIGSLDELQPELLHAVFG
ncbi:MAG: HAD hydrolase-like protein [Patescibacteria group bacterium]